MSTISHLSACLAVSLLAMSNDRAWPQTISTVKIVVPVAPGGANDFLARVLAAQIGWAQGLASTIENRTGAGGIIGTEAVSRSAPWRQNPALAWQQLAHRRTRAKDELPSADELRADLQSGRCADPHHRQQRRALLQASRPDWRGARQAWRDNTCHRRPRGDFPNWLREAQAWRRP
jgi:hypothetical protein